LETVVFRDLVITAGAALVHLATNASSHRSLLPLPEAIASFLYITTTVIQSTRLGTVKLHSISQDK
jgi:hypothetical protein